MMQDEITEIGHTGTFLLKITFYFNKNRLNLSHSFSISKVLILGHDLIEWHTFKHLIQHLQEERLPTRFRIRDESIIELPPILINKLNGYLIDIRIRHKSISLNLQSFKLNVGHVKVRDTHVFRVRSLCFSEDFKSARDFVFRKNIKLLILRAL